MNEAQHDRTDQTMFMSGGSRGIGLAIAARWAQAGANVALLAKTAEPDPKLPGTVFTAAQQIEKAGGHALPLVGDVRDDESIATAIACTVQTFGGIDVCVNNASALSLDGIRDLSMKRYDLIQDINTRGTYAVSRACLPHLEASTRRGRTHTSSHCRRRSPSTQNGSAQ